MRKKRSSTNSPPSIGPSPTKSGSWRKTNHGKSKRYLNIEDLEDPVLAKEHIGETEASDHNLYVRGQFMYQSNYVSGLRILDISDPVNPREVAYFDSVPVGDNSPGFAGSWSNYPFFESGVIVFTSMREGLFVVRRGRQPVL